MLMAEGLRLNLGSLTPFARWLPPSRRLSRIFDTRFYIARAPEDAPTPFLPDGRETTRIFWTRPQDMLESAGQGAAQSGKASGRERGCQYGWISVVAGSL